MLDQTHHPALKSWVASANAHADFPIQNLPLGIFSINGDTPRGGVAIGDSILDLTLAIEQGLFSGEALQAAQAATGATLNPLLALGKNPRRALRLQLSAILSAANPQAAQLRACGSGLLHGARDCVSHLPAMIGDYTDFYAGIHHAENVGRLFRPDHPLLPNYKYVPIGYHGRASSIVTSGTAVRRPHGQSKGPDDAEPSFGPSQRLDYELELGIWLGPGNALGEPINIADAPDYIAGFGLLNDWSARDLQAWEYQPLGPFLAKNFLTSVSPWIITPEALVPFAQAQARRPEGDPRPLDYLWNETDQKQGALNITLEAFILTAGMKAQNLQAHRVSHSNAADLYWTVAQMVTHHASGGCNLKPGDLFGSGTISGIGEGHYGSLLELTRGGKTPIALPSGETRIFLEAGDEIIFRARANAPGAVTIGFGECRSIVLA
jgi:fumarylacetoacetase